jgi:hypothetical protein
LGGFLACSLNRQKKESRNGSLKNKTKGDLLEFIDKSVTENLFRHWMYFMPRRISVKGKRKSPQKSVGPLEGFIGETPARRASCAKGSSYNVWL